MGTLRTYAWAPNIRTLTLGMKVHFLIEVLFVPLFTHFGLVGFQDTLLHFSATTVLPDRPIPEGPVLQSLKITQQRKYN